VAARVIRATGTAHWLELQIGPTEKRTETIAGERSVMLAEFAGKR